MNIDVLGRTARTIDDATDYILLFVARNRFVTDPHVIRRSHAYDLYIPWLIEVVENTRIPADEEAMSPPELEVLYMDAAWSLCQNGILRPGPRRATGEVTADGLGKGYSLTPLGRDKVDRIHYEDYVAEPENQARTPVG